MQKDACENRQGLGLNDVSCTQEHRSQIGRLGRNSILGLRAKDTILICPGFNHPP